MEEKLRQTRVLILADGRSGCTWFMSLLNNHEHFHILGEPLNTENGIKRESSEATWAFLNKTLADKPVVGFKVTPEQLQFHKLTLAELLLHMDIDHIIVFWRESILESFVSWMIAMKSKVWYTENVDEVADIRERQITLDVPEFLQYRQDTIQNWKTAGRNLPLHCRAEFMQYEELRNNVKDTIRSVWKKLEPSYAYTDTLDLETDMIRQNPEPIHERILNWSKVEKAVKSLSKANLSECFLNGCLERFPPALREHVPEWEPPLKSFRGSTIRVSEPFISKQATTNVLDAINGLSISSASVWPEKMATKLKKVFNVPVAQPCSNGFTALLLALQSCDFHSAKDDYLEVIMPSFTMVAVPNAAYFLRLKPVFVDNCAGTYNPGVKEIEAAGTNRTRAVVVTYTYGVPCDIENIVKLCKTKGWILIEDISEAVGLKISVKEADGSLTEKYAGTFGDFGCASLYANKIITAGDGGFVISNHKPYAVKLKQLTNHGFTGGYHFLHVEKSTNSKINGLGAAMCCGNIDHLEEIIKGRSQIAMQYRSGLRDCPVKCMPQCGTQDSPWVFGIECKTKDEKVYLRQWLADHGIETRNYFLPLSIQPAYLKNGCTVSNVNCQILADVGFYLPTYHGISDCHCKFICSTVRNFFDKHVTIQNPPLLQTKRLVTYEQSSNQLNIRTYGNNGNLIDVCSDNSNSLLNATRLMLNIRDIFANENFSDKQKYIGILEYSISELKNIHCTVATDSIATLQLYQKYLKKSSLEELPLVHPWLDVSLTVKTKSVPTTTEEETLQCLYWLAKTFDCQNVIEIGAWFGASTRVIAEGMTEARRKTRDLNLISIDCFKWQKWMNKYHSNNAYQAGDSILDNFCENVMNEFGHFVKPIVKNYEHRFEDIIKTELLSDFKVDMVFFDFSDNYDENCEAWLALEKYFVPNHTLLVINGVGLGQGVLRFLTDYYDKLEALYKPFTLAKVFRYQPSLEIKNVTNKTVQQIELSFAEMPGWDHHLNLAFERIIDQLKRKYFIGSKYSNTILFIPAVEQYLCDFETISQPWIGIVHEVIDNPQYRYVPDLKRLMLCHKYSSSLRNCVGLFTLTTSQKEFIIKHMPVNFEFPVARLYYPYYLPNPITAKQDQDNILTSSCNALNNKQRLVLIGSYMRDYSLFFRIKIPQNYNKFVLAGQSEDLALLNSLGIPQSVQILTRLTASEYEILLQNCVPFLCFKAEGAASTLLLECIARNIPIVVPNFPCCVEYVGKNYPLLYDPTKEDFTTIITKQNVETAEEYLENLDKSHFKEDYFLNCFDQSAVLYNSVTAIPNKTVGNIAENCLASYFDCTVLVISYKRLHNMNSILEKLSKQSFAGTMEIIVWNNNLNRSSELRSLVEPWIRKSSNLKTFRFIDSSTNYYCSPRMAMVSLMKSEVLLICDDDIIPSHDFVETLMVKNKEYPLDVLCYRGHRFFPHKMSMENPNSFWNDYEHVRFIPDDGNEQFVHFVHADVCVIPIKILRKLISIEMPDPTWILIDDYWMSFVLSYYFGAKLRKISTQKIPFERTECSEDETIALYKQPEVADAKLRFYIYHMNKGWPVFAQESVNSDNIHINFVHNQVDNPTHYSIYDKSMERVKIFKQSIWKKSLCGFNISSTLCHEDVRKLKKLGVKLVRIGAVGTSASESSFDLDDLIPNKAGIISFHSITRLVKLIEVLQENDIFIVITLNVRIYSSHLWTVLAQALSKFRNVIGYDLVNEPYSEIDDSSRSTPVAPKWSNWVSLLDDYCETITGIRSVDAATPIIIESTYWASPECLQSMSWNDIKKLNDDNILYSFHFYQPRLYVCREKNGQQYQFPGVVPMYSNKYSPVEYWNAKTIDGIFDKITEWTNDMKLDKWQIFVGELGCSRDAQGAVEYLKAVLDSCKKNQFTSAVYAFREFDWEVHNYELGADIENSIMLPDSVMMQTLSKYFDVPDKHRLDERIPSSGDNESEVPKLVQISDE